MLDVLNFYTSKKGLKVNSTGTFLVLFFLTNSIQEP